MLSLRTIITMLIIAAVLGTNQIPTAGAFSLPGMNRPESVKPANGSISLPVAKITSKARHYVFSDGGKEIRFFAVKGSNGAIRVAFDACDACYREKKGYEQKDDRMICRNCNMKFPVDRLGPNATGGCNPGYLPHRQMGNSVVIAVSDLKTGARYF